MAYDELNVPPPCFQILLWLLFVRDLNYFSPRWNVTVCHVVVTAISRKSKIGMGDKALINAWCFIQYHMKKSVRNTVTVRNLQSVKVVKTVVHRLSTGRGYLWGGKLFKIYSYKALVFRMTLPRSLHPFCTSTKLQ